ncbi:MAG: hypothetical protein ACK54H_10050 [Phycisphaerales bacterium]|jgi:hypothetical protein
MLRILLLCTLCALVGCRSGGGPTSFEIPEGAYAKAFDVTRDVLRDRRFDLERIDAAQGVITTRSKQSSGLFTPWDGDQSDLRTEIDDSINHQSRRVRITFEPENAPPDAARTAHVEVIVYRMQDNGLRPNPRGIMLTSRTSDPEAAKRGVGQQYEVATTRDDLLAGRLAREIIKAMNEP